MSNKQTTFAERLEIARKAAGFKTRTAFIDAVGLPKGTVASWEIRGSVPDLDTLKKIANLLKVSPAWLAGFADDAQGNLNLKLENGQSVDVAAIEKIWPALQAILAKKADNLSPFVVTDDALKSEGIDRGDTVLIDTTEKTGAGLFVIETKGAGRLIRRLNWTMAGDLIVTAAPGEFETLNTAAQKRISIVDRVVWHSRMI